MRYFLLLWFLCTTSLLAESLSGLWQVSTDGKAWQSVRLPANLHGFLESRHFLLRRKISGSREMTGWRTGIVSDAAIFSVNGIPLNDEESPPASYDRNRILAIPPEAIDTTMELQIEFSRFFPHEYGLLGGAPAIGDVEQLRQTYMLEQLFTLLLPSIFLMLALHYAIAFLLFRHERSTLPLSLFLLLLAIYLLQRSDLKYSSGIALLQLKRMEYVSLMLLLPALLLYFHFLLQRRPDRQLPYQPVIRSLTEFTGRVCSFILLLGAVWILLNDDIRQWDRFNTLIVQPCIWPLIFLVIAVRLYQHWRIGRPFITGLAIAFVGTLLDIASHQEWIHLPPAAPLSLLAFVGGLSLSQMEKSNLLRKELALLNASLERRVEQRTEEYRRSLTEIRILKEQQDGDYFLTSLMLRPLGCNNASGGDERLTWASCIRQKKSFTFKKKQVELGGDINIVETLCLRGRQHVAFLNADAMGKSIQGAGGAVVIGTVLKASLQRTRRQPELSALYPEEWLRRCYEDLHSVFSSFDGSMMASAVLGLIDTTTGCLYHWNAEHPALILVRQGRADLLQPSGLFRLGAPLPVKELRVHVFSLRQGDVIYAGTDGRDDLSIDGQIRTDAHRILPIVQELEDTGRGGDLSALVEALQKEGQLTDDIALLRFAFNGKPPSLPRVLRRKAASLLQKGHWTESLPTLESYLDLNPSDEQSLRVGVRIARRLGHPLAERWDRRLRLRDSLPPSGREKE